MNRRPLLALLAVLLGLPLLGYLWPLPSPQVAGDNQQPWLWPDAETAQAATPAPARLALFWPGKSPASSTPADGDAAQTASTQHTWKLIGVIRQGARLSALVQNPELNILTLQKGDPLDAQRSVRAIYPTRLSWQDTAGKTGDLPLYPDPAPE